MALVPEVVMASCGARFAERTKTEYWSRHRPASRDRFRGSGDFRPPPRPRSVPGGVTDLTVDQRHGMSTIATAPGGHDRTCVQTALVSDAPVAVRQIFSMDCDGQQDNDAFEA